MVCTDENLSANDLAAVRLTCKELYAAATKEFAQRYFKDPFVMMSEESLEALVEICKHPVFGPHVSKIQMLNTRIHTCWLQNLTNEMTIAANNRQVVEIKRTKGQMQWLMDMLEEQNDFEQSARPLELLKEAFGCLKGSGRSLVIGAQRISMPYAPIGLRKAFSGCDEQPHEILLEPDMISTLQLLLDAVSSAGCMMQRSRLVWVTQAGQAAASGDRFSLSDRIEDPLLCTPRNCTSISNGIELMATQTILHLICSH
jgi:hypothetical protein